MERRHDSSDLPTPEDTEGQPPYGGGPPEPPFHYRFSTRDLPPEGKFETWRDLWMRRIVGVEVSTQIPEAFEGEIDLWTTGALDIVRCSVKQTLYERTPSLASNHNDDFSLTLWQQGRAIISMDEDSAEVRPGGAFFLSHDRPFTVDVDDNTCFLLRIDRKALLELLPRDFDVSMQSFAQGSRFIDLIRGYIPLLTGDGDDSSPQARAMLGRHLIDLVALMLQPSTNALELIGTRGLKEARTKALLEAIDQHFARPDLTPEMLGRHLGISARQVHRLLIDTPKTFTEHLLERRLLHAHRLLTEAAGNPVSIASIAQASGFTQVSYFSRAFRIRFGDTPTGVRATAARDETMRFLRQSVRSAE